MIKTILTILILYGFVFAHDNSMPGGSIYSERSWGLGAVVRIASVPYTTGSANQVGSFIPLLYYEGDYLYFNGLEGGVRFALTDHSQLRLFSRLQFFDIDKRYQNQVQGDNIFWGLQYKIMLANDQFVDTELLSDHAGNYMILGRYGWNLGSKRWEFKPFIEGRLKSTKYNSTYSGLTPSRIPGGVSLAGGFTTRMHITSNFYLLGAAEVRRLDNNIYNSKYVRDRWKGEIYFGIAFSNNIENPANKKLAHKRYIRISHGWGTFSDVSEILKGKIMSDRYNHQMTSVFFGQPLDDRLFGLPIHIYFNAGIANHWISEVQDNLVELLFNIKFYYTIPLPVRLRFGVAEGFSYITEATYIEKQKLGKENYKPSSLLNFLDFSLDTSLGDILGKAFNPLWLGWSMHHRSGIFETAQHFGRIKGGSNYNTLYFQYHF